MRRSRCAADLHGSLLYLPRHRSITSAAAERAVTVRLGAGYSRGCWSASADAYYRAGRDIIDWVWYDDVPENPEAWRGKWHSEQTSRLNTFGIGFSGSYTVQEGFLRRVRVSYGYVTTDRNADIVARSAMDFMRHKAALGVEFRFLRRMSFALTGSLFDRNGDYTAYPVAGDSSRTETRGYEPYFLLDGRLQWEKGFWPPLCRCRRTSPTRATAIWEVPAAGLLVYGGRGADLRTVGVSVRSGRRPLRRR